MTVKELKEKLTQFDNDLHVMIPNEDLYRDSKAIWYVPAMNISQGVNELDACLFIDGYVEED